MKTYTLIQAITYDGDLITKIEMDLEGLTVGDLERAEKVARTTLDKRENMSVPETNKKYLACVAAKAAKVKLDMIKSLSGQDYTQICLEVQNFLLGGESDLEKELMEDTNENSSMSISSQNQKNPASTESQTGLMN